MKKIDFKSRAFTMFISVCFAIVFWGFVIMDSNTTRVADVRNVPVSFRGEDRLSEKGLVITSKSKDHGTLRIEGGANVLGNVNDKNSTAYIDVGDISAPGEYEMGVSAYTAGGSVVVKSFSPSKIKIVVEERVEKQVPVEIVYDKEVSDEYWIDYAKVQNERVTVIGGENVVQSVARAVVNVKTDSLISMYEENPSHVYEASLPVIYVDGNNNRIEGLNTQSDIVSINVMSKKTVKIDASGAVKGTPASGFSAGNVDQSLKEIDIVGKKSVINNIESLSVDPVNIEGARESVVADVRINTVEGVMLVGVDKVKLTVEIKAGS